MSCTLKLALPVLLWVATLISYGECWKVVGGKPAVVGEFPYQVSVRKSYNDIHFCGGTIISPSHILTAAHCMFYSWGGPLPPIVVSVVAGQLDLPLGKDSIIRNASRIIIHENFTKKTWDNDVALIKLDKELPLGLNSFVNLVPLQNIPITSGKCSVTGWGSQSNDTNVGSPLLLSAEVDLIPFSKCQDMYAKLNITIFDGMMCAGEEQGQKDACKGDSGGPLVCNGFLTGIISTGYGCGEADYPGLYANISHLLPWITKTMSLIDTIPTTTTVSHIETTPVFAVTTHLPEITTNHVEMTTNATKTSDNGNGGNVRAASGVLFITIFLCILQFKFFVV